MTILITSRGRQSKDVFHKPLCPKCRVGMWLATIEPHTPGYELRTFRCLGCQRVEKVLVKHR